MEKIKKLTKSQKKVVMDMVDEFLKQNREEFNLSNLINLLEKEETVSYLDIINYLDSFGFKSMNQSKRLEIILSIIDFYSGSPHLFKDYFSIEDMDIIKNDNGYYKMFK